MQISLPILILSVLIAVVGLKSLLTINSVIARTDIAISNLSPATTSILNADRDLYQAELALREYVVLTGAGQPVAEAQQDFAENVTQAFDRMENAATLVRDHDVRVMPSAEFLQLFNRWRVAADQVIGFAAQNDIAQARALISGAEGAAFDKLREEYNGLGERIEERLVTLETELSQYVSSQKNLTILLVVIALAIATITVIFSPGLIVKPLAQLKNMVSELASVGGDLTRRIPVSSDNEIGDVAKRTNDFIATLQVMMQEVQRHLADLEVASANIAEKTSQTSSKAEEQTSNIDQVLTAIHQMQHAVQEIAAKLGCWHAILSKLCKLLPSWRQKAAILFRFWKSSAVLRIRPIYWP